MKTKTVEIHHRLEQVFRNPPGLSDRRCKKPQPIAVAPIARQRAGGNLKSFEKKKSDKGIRVGTACLPGESQHHSTDPSIGQHWGSGALRTVPLACVEIC